MSYLLLLISIAFGTGKNIISKLGGDYFSNTRDCMKLNAVTSVLACFVFGIAAKGAIFGRTEPVFFVMAFLYGLCTLCSQVFYIAAVQDGAVSVCALIYSCGFIMPTIFAGVFFKEHVTGFKFLGIALLIVCTAVAGYKKEKTQSYHWVLPACLAMTGSGVVGILQKLVRNVYPQWNMNEYLLYSFGFMLLLSLAGGFLNKGQSAKFCRKYALCTVLLSVCVVGVNQLNLYLSGVIPGVIFFPCVNGGCLVMSAVMSGLIFRERFERKKILAIAGSVLAILLVSVG